jgi:hypothetical protein
LRCNVDSIPQQDLAARQPNRFQIVEITSQLIGVVAIEEQAQGIRISAQVLPIEQLFQLRLLRVQPVFEGFRLHVEVLELHLQPADPCRQVVQFALRGGYCALGLLKLIPCLPPRALCGSHLPAQGVYLVP